MITMNGGSWDTQVMSYHYPKETYAHGFYKAWAPSEKLFPNNLLLINSCVNCKIDISFFYSGIFIYMLKMIIVYNGLRQCAFAGSKEHNAFKKVHNIDQ